MEGHAARILRPRILIYGLLLVGLLGAFAYALSQRVPLALDVIRDRNQLFRERAGLIENVYTVKVLNMDLKPHRYRLRVEGIPGLALRTETSVITADGGTVVEVPVSLHAEEGMLHARSTEITFVLGAVDNDALTVREKARFLGPFPSP